MERPNSTPPLNHSINHNEDPAINKEQSQKIKKDVSVVEKKTNTKGLKNQGAVTEPNVMQIKPLSDRNVYSEGVLKLEKLNIPESYLKGCEKYAKHLSQSYSKDTHKVLTLGKQCCMIDAFLHQDAGELFDEYVISRPCSAIKTLVQACINKKSGKVKLSKLNAIFDQLIPKKEELDGKILVVSRNLCLIESMALVKPHLESYLKQNDIPYHFDFAVSEVPAGYVDTNACETTTKQYYEKMAVMEKDSKTTLFKGPPEEINADPIWFSRFMLLNVDYNLQVSRGELKFGGAVFEKNPEHKVLMDFLLKKKVESQSTKK